MNEFTLVSPDWLALRGPADDAARSRELADAAARLIGAAGRSAAGQGTAGEAPVVVHDLGSGTGAMMRWLAPLLPGPQTWVLHDGDAGILEHLDPRAAVDASGSPVAVRTSVEQLAQLRPEALAGASLITASALLDVVTREEARAIVDACVASGAPALFSLSVTGRVVLDPPADADPVLRAAFNAHQRRAAAGRRMLGPDAVEVVAGLFAESGWEVRTAGTPWRLAETDRDLIAAWLDGWIDAALEQQPELADLAQNSRLQRLAQLVGGALRVVVDHEDVLAWPR